MLEKIISGGQTGVDRAGLDVAIAHGIAHGGWCPKDRIAEDGIIPTQYQLQTTNSSDVNVRTRKNIMAADGTIVFVPYWPLDIADGTALTITYATNMAKPLLIIDLSAPQDVNEPFNHWLHDKCIETLNIAGPRESNCPGIYTAVYAMLTKLLCNSTA